jgi:predicted MPP superfamily phosphohydrolase
MSPNKITISERNETVLLFNDAEGVSLMHISDIHLWYSTRVLEELTDLIVKNQPKLLVLTGDYFDIPIGAQNFKQFLMQVSRISTVVFVFGNHDRIYGRKVMNMFYGIPNCTCVDDTVFSYRSKGGNVFNFTSWKNRNNLPGNTSQVNIILVHNPEQIKENELSNVNLILAGHLHGGQFRIFKTRSGSHFPGNIFYKYGIDRKQVDATTIIVSRGLGDTFPFRWNCPKEVVNVFIR